MTTKVVTCDGPTRFWGDAFSNLVVWGKAVAYIDGLNYRVWKIMTTDGGYRFIRE